METLSFVLGMSTVAVIAIAVVAVVGFVKAKKTEERLTNLENELSRNIAEIYNSIGEVNTQLNNNISDAYRTLTSNTDSRFDKLINTLERDYITKKNKLDNSIDYNN
jgi:predicted PurR-regulated permease PerM